VATNATRIFSVELPTEIICEIGKKLEGADLMKFSIINRKIYELMENDRKREHEKYENKKIYSFNSAGSFYLNYDDRKSMYRKYSDRFLCKIINRNRYYFYCVKCGQKTSINKYVKDDDFCLDFIKNVAKTTEYIYLYCQYPDKD
jgi:hypothetical protein